MRRALSHAIAAGVLALSCGAAWLIAAESPRSQPETEGLATASSKSRLNVHGLAAPQNHSCKPTPPVRVSLRAASGASSWSVRIETDAPVADAVLTLGATAGSGNETATQIAWRGALAPGEPRDVQVQWSPPAGSAAVWAEVAADEQHGFRQRARAAVTLAGGRDRAAIAAEDAADARTVVDPQTGQAVFEVRGVSGGGR